MTDRERMVAMGLLTPHDAESLCPTLQHTYPTDETAQFDEVLKAIDDAEREVWHNHDPANDNP